MPPFDVVNEWFNQQNLPIISDTQRLNILLNTELGSFEALILAVLYSIEGDPLLAEQTITAMRNNNLTDIELWCNIEENDPNWEIIMEILIDHFRGRMRRKKAKFIIHNAKKVRDELNTNIQQLYHMFNNGNEINILIYLRDQLKGIKVKAFWFLREMRMNGVWNVNGQYCCVPDKQVGKSLERWHYIEEYDSTFNTHLQCSQIIWNYFGDRYDFPILHYARGYRCNSSGRRCNECQILDCRDRNI